MSIAVHQDKEKNEKTGKRKAGEERRQKTDFKEAACCPSAVVQGQHGEKRVCVGGVPRETGTLGKANSHFDPTKQGWGRHHHVEAAVDWCSSILLALYNVLYIRQKFRSSLFKNSQYVF